MSLLGFLISFGFDLATREEVVMDKQNLMGKDENPNKKYMYFLPFYFHSR